MKEIKRRKKINNLAGKYFNRWFVWKFNKILSKIKNRSCWICICECGKIKNVQARHLLNEESTSCGCYHKTIIKKIMYKHGLSLTKENRAYRSRKRYELKKLYKTDWDLEKDMLLREFYKNCVLCGSFEKLCVDHVWPLSKGYGLSINNALILCNTCNLKKLNKTIMELPIFISFKLLEKISNFVNYYKLAKLEVI